MSVDIAWMNRLAQRHGQENIACPATAGTEWIESTTS